MYTILADMYAISGRGLTALLTRPLGKYSVHFSVEGSPILVNRKTSRLLQLPTKALHRRITSLCSVILNRAHACVFTHTHMRVHTTQGTCSLVTLINIQFY